MGTEICTVKVVYIQFMSVSTAAAAGLAHPGSYLPLGALWSRELPWAR